ncbi:MAG: hypothetical protein U1F11_09255 [Steroidobacteraceae bacterium]
MTRPSTPWPVPHGRPAAAWIAAAAWALTLGLVPPACAEEPAAAPPAAAQPAAAQPAAVQPAAAPPAAAPPDATASATTKKICRREQVVGSRIPVKVCRSQAELDAEREATQNALKAMPRKPRPGL